MLQAHAYDHLRGKTIYVEESLRRAETARLLHDAGLVRRGWLSRQARSLVCWAASWLDRWLVRDVVPSSPAFEARPEDCA